MGSKTSGLSHVSAGAVLRATGGVDDDIESGTISTTFAAVGSATTRASGATGAV